MRETELRRLIADEFLSVIQDPRVDRTRKHSLETILVIALLAVICGADSFVAMETYAKARKEWLAGFLDLDEGVPSHNTFGRVFAALNPMMLAEAFRRWTEAMAITSKEKLITSTEHRYYICVFRVMWTPKPLACGQARSARSEAT
jgi:hypothetical protein